MDRLAKLLGLYAPIRSRIAVEATTPAAQKPITDKDRDGRILRIYREAMKGVEPKSIKPSTDGHELLDD